MVFGTSTLTTRDLVHSTLQHLRGSSRAQLNELSADFTPMQTEMALQFPVTGVQVGQALEVGLISYVVTEVNTATQTLGVVPQQEGSPGTHSAGDRVTMRPFYSTHRIITELNNELRDLSAMGLYRIESVAPDANDVVAVPDGALRVLDVWSDEPGIGNRQFPESYFRIIDAPSGIELRGPTGFDFAIIDFIVFGCSFNMLSTTVDTENVASVTGLQAPALDIPPLGAALNILAGSESQRNIITHQGETRRAEEVPPGSLTGALRNLAVLRQNRIISEANRIKERYTYTKRVGV